MHLHRHAAWLTRGLPGARILDGDDLLVVDSGLDCDTFNVVLGARLSPKTVADRVREVRALFGDRAWTWWVGPGDTPPTLPDQLGAAGLVVAETEVAMALDLAGAAPVPADPGAADPDGLVTRRATTPESIAAYARVMAANREPPDPAVLRYYEAATPAALAPACPVHLAVGSISGRAVAIAELTIGADGTGGIYNVVTLPEARRRGVGTATMRHLIATARSAGCHRVELEAAAAGVGIYARLGFQPFGQWTEFQPPR